MSENTCGTCGHFRQHYIKYSRSYYKPIDYGHCVYPRLKKRDTNTPACGKYRERK